MIEPPQTEHDLRKVMDEHGNMVMRLAALHSCSRDVADDVFQEVFLALFRRTKQFTDSEHLKAWLIRITISRSKNTYRFFKKRDLHYCNSSLFEIGASDHEISTLEDELHQAVSSLPTKLKSAIYLYYVEGYSSKEIAYMLRISESAARSRLSRARKLLRTKLERNFEVGRKCNEESQ